MVWWIQPQQIADKAGQPTGRWRMTAKSDEDGGGPFGDTSHDHASAEEAEACDACDDYVSRVAGFPSKKAAAKLHDDRERPKHLPADKRSQFEGALAALPGEPSPPPVWDAHHTSELIEFLRKRVDEVTALARNALPER